MSDNFMMLGVQPELSNYLREMGISKPTAIQGQAIPVLMAGKDLIAQSQTGTGKTFAFLLPILETIKINNPQVQALIVTPTRELALQITKEAKKLADKLSINVLCVYGGHALEKQFQQLKGHPHIVVGTPGRLLDHARRKTLRLSGVSKLVLDEADQMLHMGFLNDVEDIIRQTSANRQTMLFSATIPPKIRTLATRYMNRPIDIRLQTQNVTLDEIKQIVVQTTQEEKLDLLCRMIDEFCPYLAMVFCHTRQRVTALNTALALRGYNVDELHGDLSQSKRTQIMRRFREAKLQILVVTDIAARGIDIEGITHVFNYDIPHDVDSYIHRIGRTGRAGQTGIAVTFVVPGEQTYLRMIEQGIKASIKKHMSTEVNLIAKIDNRVPHSHKSPCKEAQHKPEYVPTLPKKRADKKVKSHGGINLRSRRKTKSAEEASPQKLHRSEIKRSKRSR